MRINRLFDAAGDATGTAKQALQKPSANETGYIHVKWTPNGATGTVIVRYQGRLSPAIDWVDIGGWTEADFGADGSAIVFDPVPIVPEVRVKVSGNNDQANATLAVLME